jgi:hypothetical protein
MSEAHNAADAPPDDEPTGAGQQRQRSRAADVEVERERTKRALIEAITRLVAIVLYMAFTLIRERDAGVVALDPSDDDASPADDWAEA